MVCAKKCQDIIQLAAIFHFKADNPVPPPREGYSASHIGCCIAKALNDDIIEIAWLLLYLGDASQVRRIDDSLYAAGKLFCHHRYLHVLPF